MTRANVHLPAAPLWLPALAPLVAGCFAVTINVTFPQEKIDSAASGIEDLVRMPAPSVPAPAAPKRDGSAPTPNQPTAARFAWMGPAVAEAQTPELKTRTPEVMAAVESRRARYPELAAALAKGCLGENSQGLVEVRPGSGCPLNLGALVPAENRDRMFLYRTLVEQNNMPAGDLARVQAAFAKANRERAPAGAWVQDDSGQWSRK
ncbi:MAG: hypothetical protein AUH29_16225 [Candidatus Rokubacteria bacterium 13_1_40CM_69_27]|nr:MAG: hypothetical protein AUH29_16225 [Candidatus Rokubacteria bacterium 13_1_40CM_69_27]